MCAEDSSRSSIGNPCYSSVDNSTLFHGCTQLADRHASYSERFSSESGSSNPGQSPSTSPTTGAAGMQIIRQSLQISEISPDIVDVIMQSWRDSTHKQYKVYINKWLQFCGEGSHDPLHPSVRSVLSFPHSLFKKGLSYSALNTARSAVSNTGINVGDVQDRTPEGKHFLVGPYLKGVFNKIKPVLKYNNIWPVDTVLDYLSLFWLLDEISLKELTLKLVMLIALTTRQRCQTLTFLDISEQYMQKNEECFNFALTDHLKQDKPGKVFGNVCLCKYPVQELWVYETLSYYVSTTEKLRNSTKLLVSFSKPHGAVTSSTIGRWIKLVL